MTFFRRLRLLLLRSNKFTQYLGYAIGEIVLVVLGILIALQMNNWNEQRKRDKAEAEILQNLLVNLRSAHEQSHRQIHQEVYVLDTYLSVLGLKKDHSLVVTDTLAFRMLWDLSLESPVINTYTELKNTGKIGLIKSTVIRERFTQLETSIENLENLIGDRLSVHQLRIDHISEQEVNFIPLLKMTFPEADYSREAENDYLQILSRPRVRNLLGMKLDLTHSVLRNRRSLHREIEALTHLIDEELAEQGL